MSAAEALRSSLLLTSRSLDSTLTDRSDLTLKKLRRLDTVAAVRRPLLLSLVNSVDVAAEHSEDDSS
jgi:hypothetical protein